MRSYRLAIGFRTTLGILIAVIFATTASAGTFKVLHEFDSSKDGQTPTGVTFHAGNLYGTTNAGGRGGAGVAYELTPGADGNWEEDALYFFHSADGGAYGGNPNGGLIFDSAGNLYGTAELIDDGEVFELSPTVEGLWNETTLALLGGFINNGFKPEAGLIFDASGNLYGTSYGGGTDSGVVFELMPAAGGGWTGTIIFSFNGDPEGEGITDSLLIDTAGNLYGTSSAGGFLGLGTVFELMPQPGGSWSETTLYTFEVGDGGGNPVEQGGLIFDAAGNLYGTTTSNDGTVFELSPSTGGGWTEKALHTFTGSDGSDPLAGLIFDASGNLYGETCSGGPENDGVVFELSLTVHGGWAETILHSFHGIDGSCPSQGLIFDSSGNLYGTTMSGGANGNGTVFEITP
jgi:uncharacterized repeat protein (TIGR03803 family)